jgi:hypothetical protein
MKSKVTVFEYGDEYIYVPVSNYLVRMKSTLAKFDDYLLRPFLPSNDLTKKYIHKLSGKNEKGVGDYFETVIAIQKSYNDWIDGKCKNRRGVTLGKVLSPTYGWIKIKIEVLINGDLSVSNISTLLTSIDMRPDGIYNFNLEMGRLFDNRSTTGRKFQREFDEKSKKFWGENCVVTGVSVPVQSCRIKSVKKCKDTFDIEGLIDVANSIRLQVSLHWLFDKGYFSFLDDDSIIIAGKFSIYDMDIYKIHPKIKIDLPEGASKYLAEHRAEFFSHLTKCAA